MHLSDGDSLTGFCSQVIIGCGDNLTGIRLCHASTHVRLILHSDSHYPEQPAGSPLAVKYGRGGFTPSKLKGSTYRCLRAQVHHTSLRCTRRLRLLYDTCSGPAWYLQRTKVVEGGVF